MTHERKMIDIKTHFNVAAASKEMTEQIIWLQSGLQSET